ncbi:MAG: hypothetical protein WCD88_18005, partial [Desulfobacterales bacterium]
MVLVTYILGAALALSCFLELRAGEPDRLFSFGLVRVLFLLPLLAGVYVYVALNLRITVVAPLFFSENVFSIVWLYMAYRLHHATFPAAAQSNLIHLSFAVAGLAFAGMGGYWLLNPPEAITFDNTIQFPRYGQFYFSSLFLVVAVFFMAWRLEIFWRALAPKEGWRYRHLVIGFFLVCGSQFWGASYRLLYRRIDGDHLLLLAALLLIAWLFILYAVARHRLLNRKLFVSRKVVFAAIAPIIFAGYLVLLGLASMLMRSFGWSLPYIFQWLLIVAGLLFVIVLVFSDKVRSSVKFFISTHFYVNKYEYRDEWLAFSSLLQGTLTEREVAAALHRILSESLYTRRIMIWLGDMKNGFRLIGGDEEAAESAATVIAADDPLALYLQNEPYFYLEIPGNEQAWQPVFADKKDFFLETGLVLTVQL